MKYNVGDVVSIKTWGDISKEFEVGVGYLGFNSSEYEYIIGPHSIEGFARNRYEEIGGLQGVVLNAVRSTDEEPIYKIDLGQHGVEILYEFELCNGSGKEYKFCEEDFLELL